MVPLLRVRSSTDGAPEEKKKKVGVMLLFFFYDNPGCWFRFHTILKIYFLYAKRNSHFLLFASLIPNLYILIDIINILVDIAPVRYV